MMELFGSAPPAPPPVQLSGAQVWLRPAHLTDWPAWAELRESSRAFLTPWEPSWPIDCLTKGAWQRRLRRQYDEWKNDSAYNFLFFRAQDQALLGGVTLSHIRRGVTQTGTLGYWIGQRYARQGYTADAVRAVCTYALGAQALHRLEAGCLPHNMPSRKLLQRVGFREEGLARGYLRINGQWEDHVLFGILREDLAA